MKKTINRLPDSELDIMLVLWKYEPPMTRIEIERVVNEKKALAPTTILSLLTRLETGNALFTGDHGRWILIFCFMTRRLLTARRFIFPILIYRTEHLFLFL